MLLNKRSRTAPVVSAALLAAAIAALPVVSLADQDAASKPPRTGPAVTRDGGSDRTTGPEARQMRQATRMLGDEIAAAARCEATLPRARFAACVAPALRHAGIGGRTNAMLLQTVLAPVRGGACRTYVLGLQAANGAAGDSAQWLMPHLYEGGGRAIQRHMLGQLALDAGMLRRAVRAAPGDVCSPHADPAI